MSGGGFFRKAMRFLFSHKFALNDAIILFPCDPSFSLAYMLEQYYFNTTTIQRYCWICSGGCFFCFRLMCPGLMIPFPTINSWKWFRGSWGLRREPCTASGAMLSSWSPPVEEPRGSTGDMYDFLISSLCCSKHMLVQGKFFF